MGAVLIIDDMEDLRFSLSRVVKKEGHTVFTAASGSEAIELLHASIIDLIYLDIGLPDTNGVDLIAKIRKINSDADIIMLTGINEAKTAIDSLRAGAIDYIVKPFDLLEFKTTLKRIMQSKLMEKQALISRHDSSADNLIGSCERMKLVKEAIKTASEVDAAVLITGETGTGKELVARAIHNSRKQQSGIFVKVDCGTLSENLIESELFGHDKGAFTDARSDKKGLVEMANGGTLFLDEIGNLPISLQPKLLRLIEESTFRKVGGLKDITVNVRIVAATNADIEKEIDSGQFREDLYYRLNVIPIALPSLRQRGEDVLLLATYFLHLFKKELRKPIQGFTTAATETMLKYDWPGNIRELRNMIEREVIFCRNEWIGLENLQQQLGTEETTQQQELVPLKEMEKRYIQKVLNSTGNNKSMAARILEISRTTLRDKLAEKSPLVKN